MAQNTTDIRLAQSTDEYMDLTRQVEDLVDELVHHGEEKCATALFTLLTLLTDSRTDKSDREGLASDALNRTFVHTHAGRLAIEQEICRVNPRLKVPQYLRKAS